MGRHNSVLSVGKWAVGSVFNCFLTENEIRNSEHALTLSPETGADSPSVSSAHWPQPITFDLTFLFKYDKSIYIMMENMQVSSNCSRSETREPECRELFCYTHSCNVQIIWNSGVVYNNVLYYMRLNPVKGMHGRPLNRKICRSNWGTVLITRLKLK